MQLILFLFFVGYCSYLSMEDLSMLTASTRYFTIRDLGDDLGSPQSRSRSMHRDIAVAMGSGP
jgi:hypothetical protein